MNGRVYDPTLGRFLSADPHIQSPYSSQSYNRYSYVSNNPLKYTDPSGYFLGSLFKAIGNVISGIASAVKSVFKAIASVPLLSQIVGAYICGNPMCFAAFTAATSYAVTGDLGMALKAGVVSYVGSVIAGQVGDLLPFETMPVANVVGNGAVGGVMSKVQGGKFSSGFIGSAAAAGLKGMNFKWFPKKAQKMQRVITAGIIGGKASVPGGGKFVNGAASAMFTQMYNFEATAEREDIWNRKAVKTTENVALEDGTPYIENELGEWAASGSTSAPSNINISPTDAIPPVRGFRAMIVGLEKVFTLDQSQTVTAVEYQNYNEYKYELVYDLVNGERRNVQYYQTTREHIRSYRSPTGYQKTLEPNTRSCLLGFIGC